MLLINYSTKQTQASTVYLEISNESMNDLSIHLIKALLLMAEQSATSDTNKKQINNWFNKPDKDLPYSSKNKTRNTPQTFLAGTLNNIMFGSQRDLTEIQSQHLEEILNNLSQLLACIDITLEPIKFKSQLVEFTK